MNGHTRALIRGAYLTDTCRERLNKVIKEYKSKRELEQYLEELEFELIIHYKVFSIDGNSDIDEIGLKKLVESIELLSRYGLGKYRKKLF